MMACSGRSCPRPHCEIPSDDARSTDAAQHLSFSLGIHHCLGSALARLEGRIAFEELTRRYPGLEPAGTPTRRQLLVLRGFESVPVHANKGA